MNWKIPTPCKQAENFPGNSASSRTLFAAGVGFAMGVAFASCYLLLGGEYFIFIPRWASVVFYPGFVAGNKAYDWGASELHSKIAGVIAVGVAYALLAALLQLAFRKIRNHRRKPDPRDEFSEPR